MVSPFFVRASEYEEMCHEVDRLRVRVTQLTAEMASLKKLNAELRNDNEKCRKEVLQLQVRVQESTRLRDSIEVLEKEREVLKKTIDRLLNVVKKKYKKERKGLDALDKARLNVLS